MYSFRSNISSNHCPDEKGTESGYNRHQGVGRQWVATIAPMKRGLKVDTTDIRVSVDNVATIAPMKRGLKVVYVSTS